MSKRSDTLQRVYGAKSGDDLAVAYDQWAQDYDRDTLEEGYILPFVVPSFLARYLPKGAGPILDAGVGTGLSGPTLRALGYTELVGMDLSAEMLTGATQKRCYVELKQAVLGEKLPWEDDKFAAVISAGVFTEGHAPADGLDELVRITKPGGICVFNIRVSIFQSGGFEEKLCNLHQRGLIKTEELSPPFPSFAFGNEDVVGRVHVLRVL